MGSKRFSGSEAEEPEKEGKGSDKGMKSGRASPCLHPPQRKLWVTPLYKSYKGKWTCSFPKAVSRSP